MESRDKYFLSDVHLKTKLPIFELFRPKPEPEPSLAYESILEVPLASR